VDSKKNKKRTQKMLKRAFFKNLSSILLELALWMRIENFTTSARLILNKKNKVDERRQP
jgi:hypothetical protein